MAEERRAHQLFTAQSHGTDPYLTIGKVSEITGASCKAIRHYEALGLIPAPQRRGTYRIYSEQDVFLIHMIRHAQQVGFTLRELDVLVAARAVSERFPLAVANELFARKQAEVRGEIAALETLERRIVALQEEMNRIFGDVKVPVDSSPEGKV